MVRVGQGWLGLAMVSQGELGMASSEVGGGFEPLEPAILGHTHGHGTGKESTRWDGLA